MEKRVGSADAESNPYLTDPRPDEGYDILIARDGTWFHEGAPIRRQALVRLFASVLRREEDGEYWLITPAERGRIKVEDAPFVAVELSADGSGPDQILTFRTNLDETIAAGPEHPIRVAVDPDTGEPSPYILVRDGLEARIIRSVYYELVDRGEPRDLGTEIQIGVWSSRTFFPLGTVPDV